MNIKNFFKKIKWFFSFKKRKEINKLQKEWLRISSPLLEKMLNKIIPENSFNFNGDIEVIEIKSNDFFVKAEDCA